MLTPLEERLLAFTREYITRHGSGPTLKEIGAALSLRSKGTVHRYLTSLVRKGYLLRGSRGWRNLRLAGEYDRGLTTLKMRGRIGSGKPIEPLAEEPEINFSRLLLGQGRFALRVQGDAMAEAGILDGDVIIVRESSTADNGDIVVALVDNGEATLRKMRRHGQRIELIPANRRLVSMIYPANRVHIQGVVTGLVRMHEPREALAALR